MFESIFVGCCERFIIYRCIQPKQTPRPRKQLLAVRSHFVDASAKTTEGVHYQVSNERTIEYSDSMMATKTKLLLHDHPVSSYAQKVRIALREKDIPFDSKIPQGLGSGQLHIPLGEVNLDLRFQLW